MAPSAELFNPHAVPILTNVDRPAYGLEPADIESDVYKQLVLLKRVLHSLVNKETTWARPSRRRSGRHEGSTDLGLSA